MEKNNPKVPAEIRKIAESVEIYDSSEKVGSIFGLHIDQIGELDSEIRGILLGINRSSDFVDHIAQRLEIDRGTAEKIAIEVNREIFQTIKIDLQSQTSDSSMTISALERVGGFTVEQDKTDAAGSNDAKEGDKDAILEGIENPPPARPTSPNIEPLIDHLLGNSVGTTEQKVEKKAPEAPTNLPTEPPKPKTDPYKELIT